MTIRWTVTAFATFVALIPYTGCAPDIISQKTISTEGGKTGHMKMNGDTVQSIALSTQVSNRIVVPPPPQDIVNYGIPESRDYRVEVNGHPIHVYTAMIRRVSDISDKSGNLVLTQASFVSFDFSGRVNLNIHSLHPVKNATLRPLSASVVPQVYGNMVSFALDKPRKLMLEINTTKERATLAPPHPLFVFTNPIETNTPKPNTPGVKYFGPGIHHIGHYQIKSNETLYIDDGAVVEGTLFAKGAQNIKVLGHGILDGSHTENRKYLDIDVYDSKNVLINGPIIRDSPHWTLVVTRSENVMIRNVKILNYRDNADGIDAVNSRHLRIMDSFIYSADDSISVKGCTWWHQDADQSNAEDITVTDSTLMNGWAGNGIRVGEETRAPEIKNLTFKNLDYYGSGSAIDVIASDRAIVSNVRLEDLRVERYFGWLFKADISKGQYSRDQEWGRIEGLEIRNVNVMEFYGEGGSYLHGHDTAHSVSNVLFQNVKIAGKPFTKVDQFPGRIWPTERPVAKNFVENLRVMP